MERDRTGAALPENATHPDHDVDHDGSLVTLPHPDTIPPLSFTQHMSACQRSGQVKQQMARDVPRASGALTQSLLRQTASDRILLRGSACVALRHHQNMFTPCCLDHCGIQVTRVHLHIYCTSQYRSWRRTSFWLTAALSLFHEDQTTFCRQSACLSEEIPAGRCTLLLSKSAKSLAHRKFLQIKRLDLVWIR